MKKIVRLLLIGFAILILGNNKVLAQVSVNVPTITRSQGANPEWINVTVGSLTGQNVSSFQFTLTYNKSVIFIDSAIVGPVANGGLFAFHADTANYFVNVAFATVSPLSGSGTLVQLKVHYVNTGTSPLGFNGSFKFNGGTPAANVTEGSITISNQVLPIVSTLGATIVSSTSMSLNGLVNPEASNTTVQFDYGTTTSYSSTVTASQSPVTGSSNVNVSAKVNGLTPNTIYHYRCKATNSSGTTFGADSVFKTIIPGNVDGTGGPDAFSCSLVLEYLVGSNTLNADQLLAADVDNDGQVTALDASWILIAVVSGKFPDGSIPKSAQMGSISFGQLTSQENSNIISIPILLKKSQGIQASYLELNIDGRYVDVENVTGTLPEGWLMVHNFANGVLKVAMSGVTPLKDGTLATITLKLKDKGAMFDVSGYAILNANINSSLSSFTIQSIPDQFELMQNYPNPFNPSTTINYSIPKTGLVNIQVYDILGNEIATLVNEQKTAGNYSVQFNRSNLSSGIYFYRMQSGSFLQVKKLLLLK